MSARKSSPRPEDSREGIRPGTGGADLPPADTAAQEAEGQPSASALPPPAPAASASSAGGPAAGTAETDPAAPMRRIATASATILHDGVRFVPGAPLPVTAAEFRALSTAGVLFEDDWQALEPAPPAS